MAGLIVPPSVPSLIVGGRIFTDLTNLIYLKTEVSTPGIIGNSTFRKYDGNSGYQVTAGKTLIIKAYRMSCPAFVSAATVLMLYADNDVGFSTNLAFTNPGYPTGLSQAARFPIVTAVGQTIEFALEQKIPAGKYPGAIELIGNAQVTLEAWGYEV